MAIRLAMSRGSMRLLSLAALLCLGATASNGPCQSLVSTFGYACEEHTVTTADGYILSLQRIPSGHGGQPAPSNGTRKIPVLLQHGILSDGLTWVINSPNESLGFILADRGYDVWIANIRGTVYSRGHKSIASGDPSYWEWSWDDLASNDLPAFLQYVYEHTGQQKVHYVGYSLGTLMAFGALSSQQENVGNLMRSASLLAPVMYCNQIPSPFLVAASGLFLAEDVYWLGLKEFLPLGKAVNDLVNNICTNQGVNCYDLVAIITGENCCLDTSSIRTLLAHEPQPTSTKNVVHLAQMVRSGLIAKYDYGNPADNMKHYSQPLPPVYNVSAIPANLPIFISNGGREMVADVLDVQRMELTLRLSHNADKLTIHQVADYSHLDFILATNAREMVYEPLMAFLKLHEK